MHSVSSLLMITFVALANSDQLQDIRDVVIESFTAVHDGYSSDEVILNGELNSKFLSACLERMPNADPFKCNWTLINLRKAGKLNRLELRSEPPDLKATFSILQRS